MDEAKKQDAWPQFMRTKYLDFLIGLNKRINMMQAKNQITDRKKP